MIGANPLAVILEAQARAASQPLVDPGPDPQVAGIIERLRQWFASRSPTPSTFELPAVQAQGLDRAPRGIDPLTLNPMSMIGGQDAHGANVIQIPNQLGSLFLNSLPARPQAIDTALSRRLYNAIEPYSYSKDPETLTRAFRAIRGEDPGPNARPMNTPAREDAWLLYLGLPQRNNTLKPSAFQPGRSKDPNAKYFTVGADTLIDGLLEQSNGGISFTGEAKTTKAGIVKEIVDRIDSKRWGREGREELPMADQYANIMGQFTWTKGADERGPYVAFYDRWDLDAIPVEGEKGRFGRPFEIYDRIYYDPKTFQPLK